mmetsp:Transcript_1936/g.6189  ORF Transcript_1936/g.6189 Transcript_1936/m.6189 type:complete len:262 (+) Transcript_1936:1034-1819(+)
MFLFTFPIFFTSLKISNADCQSPIFVVMAIAAEAHSFRASQDCVESKSTSFPPVAFEVFLLLFNMCFAIFNSPLHTSRTILTSRLVFALDAKAQNVYAFGEYFDSSLNACVDIHLYNAYALEKSFLSPNSLIAKLIVDVPNLWFGSFSILLFFISSRLCCANDEDGLITARATSFKWNTSAFVVLVVVVLWLPMTLLLYRLRCCPPLRLLLLPLLLPLLLFSPLLLSKSSSLLLLFLLFQSIDQRVRARFRFRNVQGRKRE